ncbi:MAG: metal ABC transporter permease [Rubrobacter sp.]|nr:metal ABC transporter permease [Rubrobacter sp.]
MFDWFLGPLQLSFVQRGLLEMLVLSVGAGLMGTWVVLRGLAFYSHAVGTATFPGLVLASGLGFTPPIGAFSMAVLFAGSLERLARSRRSGYDSLTALVLVGMLVTGVILASDVFHSRSNVDTLLFGSLLALKRSDIFLGAGSSGLVLVASYFLGRAWLATGFDAAAARSLGVHSAVPDTVLLVLIALVTTAALSAMGALLATTLFVVPAATSRLWARRLWTWQLGNVVLVLIEGIVGLWLSVKTNAPPGATIAMLAGGTFAFSLAVRSSLGKIQAS